MNVSLKPFLTITGIFFLINLFIFFIRDKGFDYVKYADKKEIYPTKPDQLFLQKWSEENSGYSSEELNQGIIILKSKIGIDTILKTQDKVARIAAWIFNTFSKQRGKPADTLKRLTPLQQYLYLTTHKNDKLWCGQFQNIFGFFNTCAGLINRYIEIVPMNSEAGDYHEINEVYLPEQYKWIMIDVTRNRLLTKNGGGQIFSAAGYLDYKINHPDEPVIITSSETLSLLEDSLIKGNDLKEDYFNINYALRYYITMELPHAYKPISKIKRYIWGNSWYEMYDPVRNHSNYLFRIKQFFLFALIALFVLLLLKSFRNLRLKMRANV